MFHVVCYDPVGDQWFVRCPYEQWSDLDSELAPCRTLYENDEPAPVEPDGEEPTWRNREWVRPDGTVCAENDPWILYYEAFDEYEQWVPANPHECFYRHKFGESDLVQYLTPLRWPMVDGCHELVCTFIMNGSYDDAFIVEVVAVSWRAVWDSCIIDSFAVGRNIPFWPFATQEDEYGSV